MTSTTTGFPGFAPGEHRQLLAAIHRWARTNGWNWRECWGWVNAPRASRTAVAVQRVNGQIIVRRAEGGVFGGVFRPTRYDVDSVRQAVDLLVEGDVLPAQFSSAYETGWRDGHFAADNTERTPTGLEHALAEILTAVNDTDPVGAYDDWDDCSADELHTHRELTRIRNLITEIRVRNNLPVVTQ